MPPIISTIVKLTEELVQGLKACARDEERAIPGLLRESVLENSVRWPVRDRLLLGQAHSLIGRFRSGYTDVAENHDQHLDEAYDSSDREG